MNYIEFGKELQKLSKYYEEKTGETLNIKIDEETGFLTSKVYSGTDYPQDRDGILVFLRKKIIDLLNKDKMFKFEIEPSDKFRKVVQNLDEVIFDDDDTKAVIKFEFLGEIKKDYLYINEMYRNLISCVKGESLLDFEYVDPVEFDACSVYNFEIREDKIYLNTPSSLIPIENIETAKTFMIEFIEAIEDMFLLLNISFVISLFFESAVTYIICKYNFRGRTLLYNLVIFRLIFPIAGTMPAAYRTYKMVGLLNSPTILLTATDALVGTSFLIMYSFYKGISWDYAEAAFIDGANHFDVYFKIMLRMALPAISVLCITGFIGRWNDYYSVSIFLPRLPTISYGLYIFEQNMKYAGGDMPASFSGVIIASIPCFALFVIFQNSIMQTIHMGGLKG